MSSPSSQNNFIFFGSPRFAEIVLRGLLDAGHVPVAVVCNPDCPVGRKGIITPPPVKLLAQKHGIPVIQTTVIPDLIRNLDSRFRGNDRFFGIVAAYSRILPAEVIAFFPKGIIGVHPSLLPKYRGATPIQSAILAGEAETGVTLYLIDEKMDHGPMLTNSVYHIPNAASYTELEQELAKAGAELLVKTITDYLLDGKIIPQEQDHKKATFTKKFKTEDGLVDLGKDDPISVYRKIRALSHEPGVFAIKNGKRVKLLDAVMENGRNIIITRIVEEGKKPEGVRILV
ncbi:methionyl-tRNA formyltransferase [Candidatus Wolfebacteria bacterium RIFCSPLOWO2_01_FULL_47_17b]|uniref:methionyl-tRNA formyltransferase n=1 Tax=Candidatus Wolfebacteria bacterium RIFCSPLOWO2_01_FULL_47_17b TaxID=1802558 RepID=A0A1F8DX51_9BACT|nr:MAG: methionyl-tRNA formyltransferase [Candidatus Wolfebacteria bacterium RIFCSPLOWO2_01_FULL_47_17b]